MATPGSTPILSSANIAGSPLLTIGGFLSGVAGYIMANGASVPHDARSWELFAAAAVLAGICALLRLPQSQAPPQPPEPPPAA
jgi:hypothetical protein